MPENLRDRRDKQAGARYMEKDSGCTGYGIYNNLNTCCYYVDFYFHWVN